MNTKKESLASLLTMTVVCVAAYAPPAQAGGAAEVMAGDERATIDIKAIGDLGRGAGFFARNRTGIDYHDQVSPFTLVDLTYSLGEGFDAVSEAQMAPGMGIVPRAGVQYFHSFRDGNVYALTTASILERPNLELIAKVRYTPLLIGDWRGVAQLEMVTDIGRDGHEFSTQRGRLGISVNGYDFGVALDVIEVGHDSTPTYNAGGFVAKQF